MPLQGSFPRPLPSLTIDLFGVLSDSDVLGRCSQDTLHEGSLTLVYLTSESLECIAIFKTGDVFIYKLESDWSKLTPTDKDMVSLAHILIPPPAKYRPVLMIPSSRGPVTAFGASDIGMAILMTLALGRSSRPSRLLCFCPHRWIAGNP